MSQYYVNIFASFNANAIVDPQQELMGQGTTSVYFNTVPANQTLTILPHNSNQVTSLQITSNGISDSSYNFLLFPIKYTSEAVNFVIQMLDPLGNPLKDLPLLNIDNFNFFLADPFGNQINNVTFNSNFGTLSSLTQGGFFKGTVTSYTSALSVSLFAVLTTNNYNLTGISNTFNIYPSGGIYQLRKINENFDQTAAYLSLATQPILNYNPIFFNAFLGQIVGNANSDPNTLGIETFEKIANYVSNIDDIDYSNLQQLKSLLDSVNATYQNFNYDYPPSLARLINILSVKHKRLFGQTNQWQGNFNNLGYTNTQIYGKNKGAQLNFNTAVISAGPTISPNYIVTYENFSQTYNVVNTNLLNLTCYQTVLSSVSTYPLSAYDSTWGWDLVLPQNQHNLSIPLYYTFYQFVPRVQGSLLQEFIDFNNPNNTLTITNSGYYSYTSQGGIMDNILLNNIYTSLEILS